MTTRINSYFKTNSLDTIKNTSPEKYNRNPASSSSKRIEALPIPASPLPRKVSISDPNKKESTGNYNLYNRLQPIDATISRPLSSSTSSLASFAPSAFTIFTNGETPCSESPFQLSSPNTDSSKQRKDSLHQSWRPNSAPLSPSGFIPIPHANSHRSPSPIPKKESENGSPGKYRRYLSSSSATKTETLPIPGFPSSRRGSFIDSDKKGSPGKHTPYTHLKPNDTTISRRLSFSTNSLTSSAPSAFTIFTNGENQRGKSPYKPFSPSTNSKEERQDSPHQSWRSNSAPLPFPGFIPIPQAKSNRSPSPMPAKKEPENGRRSREGHSSVSPTSPSPSPTSLTESPPPSSSQILPLPNCSLTEEEVIARSERVIKGLQFTSSRRPANRRKDRPESASPKPSLHSAAATRGYMTYSGKPIDPQEPRKPEVPMATIFFV